MTSVIAVGAVFSALEVVPLALIGFEAFDTYRKSAATPWMARYRWPILFFVAVAFWNLVGAGLFGFLINPPLALYYMQGLNLTPLLGKSVLFRWRMGTDFIGYDWGWWVDDIEFYSCYAVTPTVQMGFFRSQAANDGMILESAETTNAGGTLDSTKMYIGDDALDRQYKGLVSFDTSTLPDNAVIISATLRLKQSVPFIGQNVFNTHGYLVADVRRNMFGTSPSLQTMDFNVSPNLAVSGQFNPTASGGRWRSAYLSSSAPFISLGGVTQFRVYFTRDDNDDISADYIRFFTGEAGSKAPQLFVYYFIP